MPIIHQPSTLEELTASLKESSSSVVLLDFYADWCKPCLHFATVLEGCAVSLTHTASLMILKINIDTSALSALHTSFFAVRSIPTLVVMDRLSLLRALPQLTTATPETLKPLVYKKSMGAKTASELTLWITS